ncbi:MAG: hypothetical protein WKF59_19780 [Chitinophagaceae bacterium]
MQRQKKCIGLSALSSRQQESPDFEGMAYQALADLTRMTGAIDSSFMFSRMPSAYTLEMNDTLGLSAAYRALSSAFDTGTKPIVHIIIFKKALP